MHGHHRLGFGVGLLVGVHGRGECHGWGEVKHFVDCKSEIWKGKLVRLVGTD